MARQPELAVGVTAVIGAVTHEVPRVLVVRLVTTDSVLDSRSDEPLLPPPIG